MLFLEFGKYYFDACAKISRCFQRSDFSVLLNSSMHDSVHSRADIFLIINLHISRSILTETAVQFSQQQARATHPKFSKSPFWARENFWRKIFDRDIEFQIQETGVFVRKIVIVVFGATESHKNGAKLLERNFAESCMSHDFPKLHDIVLNEIF